MFLQGRVQVLYVGAMVHVMVEVHGFLVDERLESVIGVGERR